MASTQIGYELVRWYSRVCSLLVVSVVSISSPMVSMPSLMSSISSGHCRGFEDAAASDGIVQDAGGRSEEEEAGAGIAKIP